MALTSTGGFFRARLNFPQEYPMLPPKMRFETPIFHPNSTSPGVQSSWSICADKRQSTRMAKSASRSSTHRKKTSTATSLPQSAGHPSRPPRRSSCPSSLCCRVRTMSRPQTSKLRRCGARTRPSLRSAYGSACGTAWSMSRVRERGYGEGAWNKSTGSKGLEGEYIWHFPLSDRSGVHGGTFGITLLSVQCIYDTSLADNLPVVDKPPIPVTQRGCAVLLPSAHPLSCLQPS
jgi:hypothetical protein